MDLPVIIVTVERESVSERHSRNGFQYVSMYDKNISVWFTVCSRQNVRRLFFFTKTITSEVYATELLELLIAQLTENEIVRFSSKMAE